MLTESQNITLQTLVTRAWDKWKAEVIHRLKIEPGDKPAIKAARDKWYRDTLEAACGRRSVKDMNTGRDMDQAAAAFEALIGEDFTWQTRRAEGEINRALHAATEASPTYFKAKFRSDRKAFAAYVRGIAKQRLGLDAAPELHTLSDEQITGVIRSLMIDVHRHRESAAAA